MIVDEFTGLKFSKFHSTKKGMVEPLCEMIQKWKNIGIEVSKLRMDNAGENKCLDSRLSSKDWKFNIQIEYTASNTPQQNYLVENGFHTIQLRGKAMMVHANIPLEL